MATDVSSKRWKRFRAARRSFYSLWAILIFVFFSFTAELWSNNRPLLLSYGGSLYFPAVRSYHPSQFGVEDLLTMDYRGLKLGPNDWAVWPVNRWDPFENNANVVSYPAPPTGENLMGTDDRGRDVFARLLYGFRYSITYAVAVWALCVLIATALGGMMGFFGGWVDIIGQRLVEILSTIPTLFLLIILMSIFELSLGLLIVLTSLFGWIGLQYYVRAEFLRNRKREYVEAARAVGVRTSRILFVHVLPNSLVPIITFSPFLIADFILQLATLDFLGFGLRPPTPSWGELLNQAYKNFTTAWWLAVYPGLALFITLVLLTLIGHGVRSAFDPRRT